jgi:thiol-disulfide isomerase/thioredoxin
MGNDFLISGETKMQLRWNFLCLGLAAVGVGCAPEPAPTSKPTSPAKGDANSTTTKSTTAKTDSTKPPTETTDESGLAVTPIDADGLQAAVNRHAGKVVLVDCWATYCIPCMKEFPKTVELHRKHAEDGLVVMSLSFDDLAEDAAPAKVRNFLKKQDANFEHYISKLDLATEEAQAAFAIEGGGLPHYKLYDREGKLIAAFANPEESEDVPADAPALHETVAAAVAEALQKK